MLIKKLMVVLLWQEAKKRKSMKGLEGGEGSGSPAQTTKKQDKKEKKKGRKEDCVESSSLDEMPKKKKKQTNHADGGGGGKGGVLPSVEKEERQEVVRSPLSASSRQQQPQQQERGRHFTVSIAVAASILNNVQSMELRTYVVGEIARAAAIFHVDEVVLYGDPSVKGGRGNWEPTNFFARLLQYVETPQYLRKALFPHHPDLRLAGVLNPLDAPHHPRMHERLLYREGVTVDRPLPPNKKGTLVDVGLKREVLIDYTLKPGVRVTLKMPPNDDHPTRGVPVSPAEPREAAGLYWGYTTRVAGDLGQVFSECPFEGGYDVTMGTSERGHQSMDDADFALRPFQHLLIVFGGVAGLEACVKATEGLGVAESQTHTLFDMWVNVCPDQGSRTIRTEEAITITLARMRPLIKAAGIRGKDK